MSRNILLTFDDSWDEVHLHEACYTLEVWPGIMKAEIAHSNCGGCARQDKGSAEQTAHNMPRDEIRLLAESILTCLADGQVDNAKILAESIIAELSPVG